MFKLLKSLLKHSAIYGGASFLTKAIGFLLLPLYTSYLSPSDYGILEIIVILMSITRIILVLGLDSALMKSVLYDMKVAIYQTISTVLLFIVCWSVFIIMILISLSQKISIVIFDERSLYLLLILAFLTDIFSAIITIPLARLRVQNKSLKYGIFNLFNFIFSVLLIILFLVVLSYGLKGLFLAYLLSSFLFCIIGLWIIRKDINVFFSYKILRDLLGFGTPLVPMAVASLFLTMADRFFIQYYLDLSNVGIYAIGYKIGMIMSFIVVAFQTAWPPIMYKIAKLKDAKSYYSSLITYLFFLFIFLTLILSLFSKEIIFIMTTRKFYPAVQIIPFILLSYAFWGMYFACSIGLNLKKKTQYQAIAVILGTILNLVLNYIFIPPLGILGAAVATLVSYSVIFILIVHFSNKFYKIRMEYIRWIKIMVFAILLFFINIFIMFDSIYLDMVKKIFLIVCFPFLLLLFRFYTKEEIEKIKTVVAKIHPKIRMLGFRDE